MSYSFFYWPLCKAKPIANQLKYLMALQLANQKRNVWERFMRYFFCNLQCRFCNNVIIHDKLDVVLLFSACFVFSWLWLLSRCWSRMPVVFKVPVYKNQLLKLFLCLTDRSDFLKYHQLPNKICFMHCCMIQFGSITFSY